jgi:hypothetical protein
LDGAVLPFGKWIDAKFEHWLISGLDFKAVLRAIIVLLVLHSSISILASLWSAVFLDLPPAGVISPPRYSHPFGAQIERFMLHTSLAMYGFVVLAIVYWPNIRSGSGMKSRENGPRYSILVSLLLGTIFAWTYVLYSLIVNPTQPCLYA